jgi:hypothetical protein
MGELIPELVWNGDGESTDHVGTSWLRDRFSMKYRSTIICSYYLFVIILTFFSFLAPYSERSMAIRPRKRPAGLPELGGRARVQESLPRRLELVVVKGVVIEKFVESFQFAGNFFIRGQPALFEDVGVAIPAEPERAVV